MAKRLPVAVKLQGFRQAHAAVRVDMPSKVAYDSKPLCDTRVAVTMLVCKLTTHAHAPSGLLSAQQTAFE